jgi:hypothetical protein
MLSKLLNRLLMTCMLCYASISFSQTAFAPPINNIWADSVLIAPVDTMPVLSRLILLDSALKIKYPNDSSEAGPRREFERQSEFMTARISTDGNSSNQTQHYIDAMAKTYLNGSLIISPCPNLYYNNWVNIGPSNHDPNMQNQGMVKDTWVNPTNNTNYKYKIVHCYMDFFLLLCGLNYKYNAFT